VRFDYGTEDGYQFYLRAGTLADLIAIAARDKNSLFPEQAKNDTYNNYWQSRDISRHLKNIKAAVLTVGGWYDAEDPLGPLKTFKSIARFNQNAINSIVMGPWSHGGWLRYDGARLGHIDFGAKTAEQYRKNVLVPFFEKHLKGKEANIATAHVFETGTNVWRQYAQWPPANAKPRTLYFGRGGKLLWQPEAETGADEYVSDPNKPVPYTNAISISVPQEYVVGDQRFASSRTDVLVYQSEVLQEDITIAGPVMPQLLVSTGGTDSDFVVKLIDVWPDELNAENAGGAPAPSTATLRDVPVPRFVMAGYQQLIRGEPFRAKFRESFITPKAMTPNAPTKIEYEMPDILHTFRRGHRIMVQIQSSWFPLIDRNPQTFVRIPDAKASDFVKATQRVYRGGAAGTRLSFPVLSQP
jgi:putative CocE/NonD family hydrolase